MIPPGHVVLAHHLLNVMPSNVGTFTHRPSTSFQGRTSSSTIPGLAAHAPTPALCVVKKTPADGSPSTNLIPEILPRITRMNTGFNPHSAAFIRIVFM